MGITAGVVAGVTALAGTTYTAVNANQQRIAGERAASQQQGAVEQQQQQAQAQDQRTKAQQAQIVAAEQQRRQMAGQAPQSGPGAGGGFQSTILTSPLGIPNGAGAGPGQGGGKTLLGS